MNFNDKIRFFIKLILSVELVEINEIILKFNQPWLVMNGSLIYGIFSSILNKDLLGKVA